MLANANPKTDYASASRNVREILAVCGKHDLPTGHPEDVATFLRTLDQNKLLAMNFWSAVARLERERPSGAGAEWMQEIIVEAVAGRTVAEMRPAHGSDLSRLASLLAGEDLAGPAKLPPEPVRAPEPAPPASEARRSSDPYGILSLSPREKAKAAQRDAEPRPITNPAFLGDERLRLVLQPDRAAAGQSATAQSAWRDRIQLDDEDDGRLVIPLAGYAEDNPVRSRVKGILIGAVAVSLIAGSTFWYTRTHTLAVWQTVNDSVHAGMVSITDAFSKHTSTQSTSSTTLPAPVPSYTAAPTLPPAPANTQQQSAAAAPQPVVPSASQRSAVAPAPQSALPAAPDTSAAAIEHPETHPPTTGLRTEDRMAYEAAMHSSGPEPTVSVSAKAMDDNLLSSHFPIYPEAARAAHIQGTVVLGATVTAEGRVTNLHVIQGDPALRRAAMEAVSSYHYIPYKVNGQPTAVTTTINVPFTLN